jgi:hypothetical protein
MSDEMPLITDVPVPTTEDQLPEENVAASGELRCTVCGVPIEKKPGPGRPPTRCDLHKRVSGGTRTVKVPNNSALAQQAAKTLVLVNRAACMGLMAVGLKGTAAAIAEDEDSFYASAIEALEMDPKLAKKILGGGQQSGKMMLAFAYGTLIAGAAPLAQSEYKMIRDRARNAGG